MGEGMLGGVLGGEEEKSEVEAPEALAGAEAFAAAVAARLSTSDPEVARETSAFLKEQTQLLKVQKEHLKDEHALRLAHLRNQLGEENVRRFGLRLRVGFQIFVALVATVIGIGFALMIRDAVSSRSVVIDPFDIAPNLAAQVPSGKIVAAGLLDVLTRIQAANYTNAELRLLSNAWTNEITIEVPEMGVSIGQIERALKTRFGHDQHIEGDLTQTEKGGLALTVRGTGILPKTFTEEARNLERLLTQAGEYVYGQSQPGMWAEYLSNNRLDEAIRFAQAAYPTAAPTERPYLLNGWANALGSKGDTGAMHEALTLYWESVRLKPDYWVGYSNVAWTLGGLGDEEGAVRVSKQMMKVAGGRPGRARESQYEIYDQLLWDLPAERADFIADMELHGGAGTSTAASGADNIYVAQIEALMHDVEAAARRLQVATVDEKNPVDVANAAVARALLAEEGGDLQSAVRQWDALELAYSSSSVSTQYPALICFSAVTYERTGHPAKADAALNAIGKLTLVDCYRFRGDVLDARGDWAGAQEWYAKAVKLAPSIPSGYYSWGVALAKHGDLDGEATKLEEANQKGPHWAEPLKAWGDVLAKQGNAKEALTKYDSALEYAPNWKQLKEARDAVAKQKS